VHLVFTFNGVPKVRCGNLMPGSLLSRILATWRNTFTFAESAVEWSGTFHWGVASFIMKETHQHT
jgi:hypothetical protein